MSLLPADPSLWPWIAWGSGLAGALCLTTLIWIVSVRLTDVSIIDPFWGLVVLTVPGVAALTLEEPGPRTMLTLGVAGLWAVRLAVHLAPRIFEHAEDRRYAAMRESVGSTFWMRSLVTVFWLQAAIAAFIAWPLVLAVASPLPVGWLFPVGIGVALLGAAIEAVADLQLSRFKADPGSRGRVMDTGLWRYSRHPNYFGDALMWWGFGLVGVEASQSLAPLLASAAMTGLLLRVSGVPLLEPHLESTRPGYREYAARTSAFILWPPDTNDE